ncbi:MAG: radical SAM protein [Candidatus Omnitrophota bacterium]|nr:radical SAM protein [Candidatus Omnitrophota bacterium]
MDKYRIDSHKLIYHVNRLHEWLEGKTTYPVYMEVSPSGACNHRCVYCGLDFMGYKSRYLDSHILKERLAELGKLGLKSIMYAGEGEPFLHQQMAEIIEHTKKSGIDVAVTTNAVLFTEDIAEETLGSMEWIKVSINGGTRGTYAKIHCCKPDDFDKVIKNMSYAAALKKKKKYQCSLGMQLLLLPDNASEVIKLAELAKDIGMDYLVIKPYSQHPQSRTTKFSSIKYSDYEYLADELGKFNTDSFNVIFRIRAMKKWDDNKRNYQSCFALPFWSYIDAGGNVWGCSVYLGDKRFLYGNIYEQSFQDIWEGKKREKSLNWFEKDFDISKCRINCRMDEINRYLWELKNSPKHVNFI